MAMKMAASLGVWRTGSEDAGGINFRMFAKGGEGLYSGQHPT